MSTLSNLSNSSRPNKTRRRVGRGTGSTAGKTCGRGTKGAGARSGHKRRLGNEGGQVPLWRKMPTRGFTRGRFKKTIDSVNLKQIEGAYLEGELVSAQTLRDHGILSGPMRPVKVLGDGELTKKVTIEANAYSAGAKEKLEKQGISYSVVE